VLSRLHLLNHEEVVRDWTRGTEEDNEDEAECEALINRQVQERQAQINNIQEDGSEDQEESERGRIIEAHRR
jgi:hypothetical protein